MNDSTDTDTDTDTDKERVGSYSLRAFAIAVLGLRPIGRGMRSLFLSEIQRLTIRGVKEGSKSVYLYSLVSHTLNLKERPAFLRSCLSHSSPSS